MNTPPAPTSRPALSLVPVSFNFQSKTRPAQGARYESRTSHLTGAPNNYSSNSEKRDQYRHDTAPSTEQSTSNIAQLIEQRLWQYSIFSGHIAAQWLLEISSIIMSAISMIAIVGVLVHMEGKRAPAFPIVLNVYVVILSKFATVTLLLPISQALGQLKWSWFQGDIKKRLWDFEIFDNASRGPWGCLLLLIRTRCKTFAALAAAVTLLSLALDPFFQQAVDFPLRWVPRGIGSIPTLFHYEPLVGEIYQSGLEMIQSLNALSMVEEPFFIANGTQPVPMGNGTRPDIAISCPSGNCTWPTYETLGVCSACEDVSQFLTFGCLTGNANWYSNLTDIKWKYIETTGPMCGYFLNATQPAPLLMNGYALDEGLPGEALVTRMVPFYAYPERTTIYGGSIHFGHIRNPIYDVLIVGNTDASSVYQNKTPTALECILHWCIKTVESSYNQAEYKEQIMNTFHNDTVGPYPWSVTNITKNGNNGTYTTYHEDVVITSPDSGRTFGLTNKTMIQVIHTLDAYMTFRVTANDSTARQTLIYDVHNRDGPIERSYTANPWAGSYISTHMQRLATGITNQMRSTSTDMVEGTAFSDEAYVAVHWPWLALHIILLLSSAMILAITIVRSKGERDTLGIFKTSAVATLMYGLPDRVQDKFMPSHAADVEQKSWMRTMRVQLQPQKGWRVSGFEPSPITPRLRHQPPPGWI